VNYLEAKTKPIYTIDKDIKQIFCFDDYTFLIDENNTAWGCGNNTKGQLGLGHTWDVQGPTPITGELKGKVKKIITTGDINIAVSTSGEMYLWGINNERAFKPLKFNMTGKITVNTVSCGGGFAVILSNQGTIFTFGKSNKQGELGTGDFLPRSHPEPIVIENEKIVQISCGFKHTLAKCSSGRVYSWGLVRFI
jgi:alpha-tubulin suppressor-like RCC1 family protein